MEASMIEKLKQFAVWIAGAAVAVLGVIFLTKRSGQGYERNATRSGAGAAEHKEMAGIALEQAKSEAVIADSHHLDAEKAAETRETIPVTEAVKRAKKGWTA